MEFRDSFDSVVVEDSLGSSQLDDGEYFGPSSDLEELRVDISLTNHSRAWSIKEHVLELTGLPSALLAHPSPITARELWSSIYKEVYFYFSNKSKEAHQVKLSNLVYYTHRASFVLAFGTYRRMKVLLHECLQKEKKGVQ